MNSARTLHPLFHYTGRRRLAAALSALALVFLFTASCALADGGAETAVVSNPNRTANLHLREDPTTDSVSLGLYPNGTKVVLMGFSDTWAHVIVNGEMGFMLGKYLKQLRWPRPLCGGCTPPEQTAPLRKETTL